MLKREYEILLGAGSPSLTGDNFIVHYGFCLNNFFKEKLESKDKKYTILKQMLEEYNISVLYGEDKDYYEKLNKWINN